MSRATRRCALLGALAAALAVAGCGDGTPAPADPFPGLRAELAAEAGRFDAVLGRKWARTIAPVAEFSGRRSTLRAWLADAELVGPSTETTSDAARARLLPDGETLREKGRPLQLALQAAEALADAADAAFERREKLDAGTAALRAFGSAPIAARVEAWSDQMRTAETAFRRALHALAVKPDRGAAEQDLRIAAGGFTAAERDGAALYGEMERLLVVAEDAFKRARLLGERLAFAERVERAATDRRDPALAEVRAATDALRAFATGPASRRAADVAKLAGDGSPGAEAAGTAFAAEADAAVERALSALLGPARRLGVDGP
jgi:hypothetical protein